MTNTQFQFKGVWIPDFVMEMLMDGEITSTDLVLLSMIFAMSKGDEGCYASREYLAEKLGMSVSHVKNSIARYRKMGLIVNLEFDGRRQKIRTCWDVQNPKLGYCRKDGRGTVESTAVLPQEEPQVEWGTVESTADQAINNKEYKSNRKISLNQEGLSPSPNPSDFSSFLLAKQARKDRRVLGNSKLRPRQSSTGISKNEGLAISLSDNLTDHAILALAEKYDLTPEVVSEQKQKYIKWIMEWEMHSKTWGRNMATMVERFCEQTASKTKKPTKDDSEPDPVNDDLYTYYDKMHKKQEAARKLEEENAK